MSRSRIVFFLAVLNLFSGVFVECANILGLMGCASPSHHVWNSVLVNKLASTGHNLTIISPDISNHPMQNIHFIHLEKTYDIMFRNINVTSNIVGGKLEGISIMHEVYMRACEGIVQSKGFKTLLNYPKDFQFDLVLHDYTLGSCLIGFLHHFNYPPMIGVSAFKISQHLTDLVGGHSYPGYVPFYTLPYHTDMNFFERVYNTLLYVAEFLYKELIFMPKFTKMIAPYFDENLPSIRKLEQRAKLVLINTHPTMDYPQSLPPNVIEIGGLHIKEAQQLPNELQAFMNSSKNGVVLISFGTNIQSSEFGSDKQKIILDVVRKMPDYDFLWKFDIDPSIEKIPNLIVKQWIPQNDVLAHPKMKAFISHGGALGTQEAVWHGVPMVGIPFIFDQTRNVHKLVADGVAEKLNFQTMSTGELLHKLHRVLETPTYRKNMKIQSDLFRDRPMKPLDCAIWWINYVLRHPNSNQLQSPVIDLGFLISNSYDVIGFFSFITFSGAFIAIKLLRVICCRKYVKGKKRKIH